MPFWIKIGLQTFLVSLQIASDILEEECMFQHMLKMYGIREYYPIV